MSLKYGTAPEREGAASSQLLLTAFSPVCAVCSPKSGLATLRSHRGWRLSAASGRRF